MTSRTTKPRPYGDFFEPTPTVGGPLLQARIARRQLAARDAWVAELQRRLCRDLRAAHGPIVAEEIAAIEVVRVLQNLDAVIERWKTPARYARQRVNDGRAYVDQLRRDGAQRGEGARHGRKVVALTAAGRVESLDADGEQIRPIEEFIGDPIDQYEQWVMSERIDAALRVLLPTQRQIVDLVVWQGLEVKEAARRLGIRRETASRRLSKALTALESLLGDFGVIGDIDAD